MRQLAAAPGPWLVVAPHMDDESLGCGMLLAQRDPAQRVHVIFASDGSRSPPLPPGDDAIEGLVGRRQKEARLALTELGVADTAVEFLGFPDGTLDSNSGLLQSALEARIRELQPAHVFVPFRYDRHPDHLAVNRAVTGLQSAQGIQIEVWEYFVYSQWRLLPSGDVRSHLRHEDLYTTFSESAAAHKRRALECHRSQTSLLSPAQRRPILTAALLDRVCSEPEALLRQRADFPGRKVLEAHRWWIPIAHRLEPVLKRVKDRLFETA
ncbi:PIG-L deacetylase family protein [Thioalkalivibrio sp.]|uniref:PIG-L deacetylase family protein n=1 Tax=Thioalkalivibrio sp. TaxID=2093813 RepID=UPI0035631B64